MQFPITNNDIDEFFNIDMVENMVEDMLRDSIDEDHL